MRTILLSTDEILDIVQSSPRKISEATAALTNAQLTAPSEEGEWSINEILAHLRGYAETRGDRRMITMIREDHPTIRVPHPNTWSANGRFRELEFHENLSAFISQRKELLTTLEAGSAAIWSRTATTTGGGKPHVITVHEAGEGLARHERSHVRQIEKLAKQMSTKG